MKKDQLLDVLRAEIREAVAQQIGPVVTNRNEMRAMVRQQVAAGIVEAVTRIRSSLMPMLDGNGRAVAHGRTVYIKPREIRAIRMKLKLARPAFAKRLGVSTWTLFMWEHGKVVPRREHADKVRSFGR